MRHISLSTQNHRIRSYSTRVFLAVLAVASVISGCTSKPSREVSSTPEIIPEVPASITILSKNSSHPPMDDSNCQLQELPSTAVTEGDLILVNRDNEFVFPDSADFTAVLDTKEKGYKVKDRTVLVDSRIMPSLNAMMADFFAATGNGDVTVVSGYRTREYQQMLLDREIAQSGEETAEKWVALPGASEHHTGLAIDFSIYHDNGLSEEYDGTGDCQWIAENCWKYGFILRYPDSKKEMTGIYYEPWHFRWVGISHAIAVTKQQICMEEYIEYLKEFPYDGNHLLVSYENTEYEIWYEPGTQIHVPLQETYTVSGNNQDGCIVTVQREISR